MSSFVSCAVYMLFICCSRASRFINVAIDSVEKQTRMSHKGRSEKETKKKIKNEQAKHYFLLCHCRPDILTYVRSLVGSSFHFAIAAQSPKISAISPPAHTSQLRVINSPIMVSAPPRAASHPIVAIVYSPP